MVVAFFVIVAEAAWFCLVEVAAFVAVCLTRLDVSFEAFFVNVALL